MLYNIEERKREFQTLDAYKKFDVRMKAMSHSSIKVSLTYLRGLEIPELKQEDMPTL